MQCIYVDVLIVLNWYINYFILLGTAKLTHTSFKRKRLVLSALVGAISSLIILLPPMQYLVSVGVKFALSVGLVLIAFKRSSLANTLKMALYFCVISFVFAGMILALQSTLHSDVIATNNSYVYADFSMVFLVVSTTVCYAVLCIVRHLLDKTTGATGEWSLRISYGGKSLEVDGLADTGNALTDTFSGKPIVICSQESLRGLLEVPSLDDVGTLKGFRLVPYSTIGESGVVVSFKPDSVTILDTNSGYSKNVDVLIGISGQCNRAIFNPKILA